MAGGWKRCQIPQNPPFVCPSALRERGRQGTPSFGEQRWEGSVSPVPGPPSSVDEGWEAEGTADSCTAGLVSPHFHLVSRLSRPQECWHAFGELRHVLCSW